MATLAQPTPVRSGHGGRKAAIVIVILVLVFFFLPIVPYSNSSSSGYGVAATRTTGQVSVSAYLFGCGLVVNLQGTGYLFGVQASQSEAVSGFFCNVSAQH